MERDDYGFTKRDPRALRRVRTCEADETDKNPHPQPSSKVAAESHTAEGVAKGPGGNPARTSPETGSSHEASTRVESTGSSSVSRQTPDKPNVVVYHPKNQFSPGTNTENEMRTDQRTPVSSRDKKKTLLTQLSRLSIDNNVFEGSTELPQVFQVKYLGSHDARGLWGIKHTRKPVDNMVAAAKSLPGDTTLPLMKLVVAQDCVSLFPLGKHNLATRIYGIETISYGVQDLIYTRVFSMIIVKEGVEVRKLSPFECHGFVCESKHHARQLTYALATAFQIYSQTVKAQEKISRDLTVGKKRFAIDLRTPDEIETDLAVDSEA